MNRFSENTIKIAKSTTARWIGAGIIVLALCLTKVFALYKQGFDLGDGSTFYMFSHFLAQGEAIYKDFIHFRTPGSYFLWSWILSLGNGGLAAVKFALTLESGLLYHLILFISLGILFRWKKLGLVLLVVLLSIMLPGYLQIRAGLAFLGIVLYIRAQLSTNHSDHWLIASGAVVALAFTFGQEMAVVAIATIGIYELSKLIANKAAIKSVLHRILRLVTGFSIGILPLLGYVLLFSNISNFLYYTTYYALFLQPKGMNLPFPSLSYENLVYYLPFAIVLMSQFVFTITRSKKTAQEDVAFALILTFSIMRLATLLGRTDFGHLVFVLPEFILLIIWSIVRMYREKVVQAVSYQLGMRLLIVAILLMLAAYFSTIFILFAAVILLIPIRLIKVKPEKLHKILIVTSLTLGAIATVFFVALFPTYISQAKQVKSGLTGSYMNGKVNYEGVYITPSLAQLIYTVKDEVKLLNADTIFSFPIQPFFYSMATHHATRFITFEPQTTMAEQEQAIADLEKTKPTVIIFDPAQALDMSQSVEKISDYILQHYVIERAINIDRILWIMVPSEKDNGTKPIFSLYKLNDRSSAIGVQSPEKGLNNAIEQNSETKADFELNKDSREITFTIVHKDQGIHQCGTVTFSNDQSSLAAATYCDSGRIYKVDIPEGATRFTLTTSGTLLWNDLTVK